MTLNVGAGILQAMALSHDHALVDSTFGESSDGSRWERCEGMYALYLASNVSGAWEVSVAWKTPPPLPSPSPPSEISIPSPNYFPAPRPVPILAIVLHSMSGTLAGTDAYFATPSSAVSAHLGVGLDGTVHRYVQDLDMAWSNGPQSPGKRWATLPGVNPQTNPNCYTLSIETEDLGDPTHVVTAAQYAAVLACCHVWIATYPTIRYLVAHEAITATACPGPRWLGGKLVQLGTDLGVQVVQ